jgi:S1-C subfamily serine protease
MDIEKLTKQQIILVTLLVSFVTSIATGIVTVALMDQAPPGVTQTINRVVERTVERVIVPPATNNAAAVVTRETVVVKEDDRIVESVDKNKMSVVRIYTNTNDPQARVFVGLGTIMTKEGLIATGDVFADIQGKYLITADGVKFHYVSVLKKPKDNQFYFLKVIQEEKNPVTFTPVALADSNTLKIGQSIIAWGGEVRNAVSTGIISSLIDEQGKVEVASTTSATTTNTVKTQVVGIMTNNNLIDSIPGGPLLNLYGEVVGIRVNANLSGKYTFLPVNILKKEVVGL